MRFHLVTLSLAMAFSVAAGAQTDNSQASPQQKPTLGPSPAPSLNGPRTAATTDPAKLLRIRTIYIETIDNGLSAELGESLAKSGRFRIVTKRDEADAVLRGSCLDSRRLRSLHSEIFLNDRRSGSSIWQDNIHQPFAPPALSKAVNETAKVILNHLTGSITQAQRR